MVTSTRSMEKQHEDAPPAANRAVKLPPFWTANLRAWFTSAEGAFRLHNITDEESWFFNCLHALPETTVSLIADLVEADPLPANPYTELRRRLLAAHQLTDIQRVEQLFNLPPLGAQKPSELLAEMLRLCPRGQENNAFFNCLFLNKLPRELRILLSEAEMADKQALGARADLFATHNSKQAHDVVAAVAAVSSPEQEGEETTVAAISPGVDSGLRGGQRGGGWRGKKKQGRGGSGGGGHQVSQTLSHAEQARIGSGLCFNHFCYGSKAPGRETRWPGAAQRCCRRAADPHAGSGFQQAFPRGHWSFLQHPSTSLFSTCLGPEAVWPGGSAHTLLRRMPGEASMPGSRFFLEISFGRCSFPHIGC
jgi:hypothetical protein